MNDSWNILILVIAGGMGLRLILHGRKSYLNPDGANPINPYVRFFQYLLRKKSGDTGDPSESERVIRMEAIWAMVSGVILTVLAVVGLVFGLLS